VAFEWTENISPGAPTNAAGLNEMQVNLDTIFADLSITRTGCASGAGWTEFPIPGGLVTDKLSVQVQELRDVTDYAHDNLCSAHDSGHQSGVAASYDASFYSGVLGSFLAAHCPAYQGNYLVGYGECPTYCPADYLAV